MLTVKKQRGEDGKQGLLGLKGFGVVTLGVMLGQEKALSSCIPCGQLVRSRASRAAGSQRAAADAPSLNGPAAGRAWRQWWGRDARVPSARGDEYVSVLPGGTTPLGRLPSPARSCSGGLANFSFLSGTPPPGTSTAQREAGEQNCFPKPWETISPLWIKLLLT